MKTVVITGANSGLGFETAKKIAAKQDFRVILACRNREKADAARDAIISQTGNRQVDTMGLDTSALDSVRAFAEEVNASGERVFALVNNAGINSMGNAGVTADGYNLVMATNYLGHFLLTQLLLPRMEETGRIYNVTSDMHSPPRGELKWPGAEAVLRLNGEDGSSYSLSKLCMIYMTHELDRRLRAEGKRVTVNSFNPGYMGDTNFMKGGRFWGFFVKRGMPDRYGDLATSSDALARLATEDEFSNCSGEYFDRGVKPARSSPLSYDRENAEELWNASLRCTGLM